MVRLSDTNAGAVYCGGGCRLQWPCNFRERETGPCMPTPSRPTYSICWLTKVTGKTQPYFFCLLLFTWSRKAAAKISAVKILAQSCRAAKKPVTPPPLSRNIIVDYSISAIMHFRHHGGISQSSPHPHAHFNRAGLFETGGKGAALTASTSWQSEPKEWHATCCKPGLAKVLQWFIWNLWKGRSPKCDPPTSAAQKRWHGDRLSEKSCNLLQTHGSTNLLHGKPWTDGLPHFVLAWVTNPDQSNLGGNACQARAILAQAGGFVTPCGNLLDHLES